MGEPAADNSAKDSAPPSAAKAPPPAGSKSSEPSLDKRAAWERMDRLTEADGRDQ